MTYKKSKKCPTMDSMDFTNIFASFLKKSHLLAK